MVLPDDTVYGMAALELEQALYRGDGLVLVTCENGRYSDVVQAAIMRFDRSLMLVVVLAELDSPTRALERLLEATGHAGSAMTDHERQVALDQLIQRADAEKRPIVVVIDDAHLAAAEDLERLRIALRITPGSKRPVVLVLAGRDRELVRALRRPNARGLWTRITARVCVRASAGTSDPGNGAQAVA